MMLLRAVYSLGCVLVFTGCATPDPFHSHVAACAVGGPNFSRCMSGSGASDEVWERRRWMARLQREQVEAEARAQRERAMAGLSRR